MPYYATNTNTIHPQTRKSHSKVTKIRSIYVQKCHTFSYLFIFSLSVRELNKTEPSQIKLNTLVLMAGIFWSPCSPWYCENTTLVSGTLISPRSRASSKHSFPNADLNCISHDSKCPMGQTQMRLGQCLESYSDFNSNHNLLPIPHICQVSLIQRAFVMHLFFK